MTTLTLVGVENDTLVLVSEDGQRFFVEINEALRDALRQRSGSDSTAHRVSPKDIQAHIRRGLTAQQVADLTGEEVSYIEKFEGAVIAERNFIVDQALAVSVTTRSGDETTFGASIRERLEEISASGEKWSAWKEETGWLIELTFQEGDVEHSARWTFHQRKHVLEPLNEDASVLSRHEPMPTTLIPKLSAVATAETESEPDRFDSEIFESSDLGETGPLLEPVPYGRQEDEGRMADTADLLEALRRKRGEREPAPGVDEGSRSAHPATGGIRLVDDDSTDAPVTPIGGSPSPDDDDPETTPPKKKRPEMPSWDDIVFGARSDDDPA